MRTRRRVLVARYGVDLMTTPNTYNETCNACGEVFEHGGHFGPNRHTWKRPPAPDGFSAARPVPSYYRCTCRACNGGRAHCDYLTTEPARICMLCQDGQHA
jgi:hypothetical protein